MSNNKPKQIEFWGNDMVTQNTKEQKKASATKTVKQAALLPENLGKVKKLPVPDFSDPNRKLTCLEADFPIAQINALAGLEASSGAAKKPIYSMSKWWARRQSSVFRSMLIAAATEAPDDVNEASKLVWDHYYCNHQKAGSFKKLRVLDCFMGGGTTLVEGSRLGMQMTGVDLNPVAWFVVKNELACSDPEQVKALFEYIERQVKPQIQPFYTTTCPRGHKGRWVDVQSGEKVEIEPMDLPPEQRPRYRWEGPEVIYTFWAKHGPCQAKGCGHRTPIFRTPVIAEKNLSADFVELTCPKCATTFNAELGETRMAPGAERVIIEDDIPFTELSQLFAKLLNDYDKGTAKDTGERCLKLKEMVTAEKGLNCPECGTFSGKKLADVLEDHSRPSIKPAERKKAAFKIQKKKVQMYLLIHPKWMQGSTGFQPVKDDSDHGQDAQATSELQIRQGAYLPHWTRDESIYSITFRLADSLPKSVVEGWVTEREDIVKNAQQLNRPLSEEEMKRLQYLFSERVEKYIDDGHGNCWMKRDEVAQTVADALLHFDQERYILLAWCVMPNHVHVVVKPINNHKLPEILHSWKSFTANKINKLLDRTGEFWQPEYYDHLIRDEHDLNHSIQYVMNNPEKAGLKNWKWRGCIKGGTGFQPVKDDRELVRRDRQVNSAFALNHGQDAHATSELGGWAGATAMATAEWFEKRLVNLSIVELRSKSLPDVVTIADGTIIETSQGTVPRQAHFTCAACGREGNTLESVRPTGHTPPVAAYALQCHCPQCDAEGYTYGGRYFKAPDEYDIKRFNAAEAEWAIRSETDLAECWPRQVCWDAYMMRANGGVNDGWGYTHWWKMFNPRQLLVHTQLLKAITEAPEDVWPLDVREQALGAFQQYLRAMSMFSFYHQRNDQLAAALSNPNFHPKNLVLETCVFSQIGSGRWGAYVDGVLNALEWVRSPFEPLAGNGPATTPMEDPLIPGNEPYCGSSTDLSSLGNEPFDLVITDPPFGNNLFYADLSDFFYVWLRLPLRKWYAGLPEAAYFEPERTPHSMEAIDNPAEHPDDREDYEKDSFLESKHLARIRELTGDESLAEKAPNPLYRPQPSSDFYSQTLSAVWAEAGRRLKDGGIMAFTFHHNEDSAWVDVLMALFNAGYVLVATYPIRSDETKGDAGAFGSRKIEYDIIHVCRKRIATPEPVSWARMRRWVKDEAIRLKELLEHTHGKTLPESDLRVILRGKSLEFYSRHYGQVLSGDGQILEVRDALLGINQLLDDLLEDTTQTGGLRPPESAEPTSRLYLRLFKQRIEMDRDELHKTLRGTGISQGDLEARGWIRVVSRAVHLIPISERFAYFTERGRNRKVIKTDLDQAHFLIGAAYPNSGLKIDAELNNPNFRIKKSVDEILTWYAEVDHDAVNRLAAKTAAQLVEHWRTNKGKSEPKQLTLFEILEEAE